MNQAYFILQWEWHPDGAGKWNHLQALQHLCLKEGFLQLGGVGKEREEVGPLQTSRQTDVLPKHNLYLSSLLFLHWDTYTLHCHPLQSMGRSWSYWDGTWEVFSRVPFLGDIEDKAVELDTTCSVANCCCHSQVQATCACIAAGKDSPLLCLQGLEPLGNIWVRMKAEGPVILLVHLFVRYFPRRKSFSFLCLYCKLHAVKRKERARQTDRKKRHNTGVVPVQSIPFADTSVAPMAWGCAEGVTDSS